MPKNQHLNKNVKRITRARAHTQAFTEKTKKTEPKIIAPQRCRCGLWPALLETLENIIHFFSALAGTLRRAKIHSYAIGR